MDTFDVSKEIYFPWFGLSEREAKWSAYTGNLTRVQEFSTLVTHSARDASALAPCVGE